MDRVRKKDLKRNLGKHNRLYTVYREKTDELVIVDGLSSECAQKMGISVDSFYSAVSRYRNGVKGRWAILVTELV